MRLKKALISSFQLLRRKPILFLPKLVLTTVWSIYWVYLIRTVKTPEALTTLPFGYLFLFLIIMAPIQVWVYNSYFFLVEQHRKDQLQLGTAFRQGLGKLPQGMTAFIISLGVALIAVFPGLIIAAIGRLTQNFGLYLAGLGISAVTLLLVTILFYFVPTSVVLGNKGFLKDFKNGFTASIGNLGEVTAISVLSFAVLILTSLLEGSTQAFGTAVFFLIRWLNSILGVYFLIINPELLLGLEK